MTTTHSPPFAVRPLPIAGTGLGSVLEELVAEREPVLYVSVPGNAGDSAINCAAHRVFEQFGLQFERVDLDVDAARTRGRVLVGAGGGNLVPMYNDMHELIARHHGGCRRLILLPTTIRGHDALLGTLGDHVTVLCRDQPSLAHVQRAAPRVRALASHDVALHLDVRALLAEARWRFLPLLSSPGQARRNLRRRWRGLKYDRRNASHPTELFAFRTDVERAERAATPAATANIDVSVEFVSDNMTPRLALEATWRMLGFLDRYTTVHTDRLHVSILSALLGKRVLLHDNSYGKNSAIYDHSMRTNFPNVELCSRAGAPP
ncbi:MAG: polysaccharide pyruvyl transferase family protein [Burkholderiaceae bacterium]